MIPTPALAEWLSDRAAQKRSADRMDAYSHEWRLQPAMERLEREVRGVRAPTSESLLESARHFLDGTAQIDAMIPELIAISRTDPFFHPPFYPLASEIHAGLLLFHHPLLSISLSVTPVDLLAAKKSSRRGPASINFTGVVTLLRFVRAGGATLSFWEAPEITDTFVASEAGQCRLIERRRIADGEEIVIDGRRRSFVIDHAEDDIVFFQAIARAECAPVGTEYDSESLRFIGASSTDEASSRLQMMVSLLRAMGRDDAFPLFEEALASPQFYTRWHIMREMLAMDADAALPSLKRMAAQDPHPDVRLAAEQTLRLFFEAEASAGETTCRA